MHHKTQSTVQLTCFWPYLRTWTLKTLELSIRPLELAAKTVKICLNFYQGPSCKICGGTLDIELGIKDQKLVCACVGQHLTVNFLSSSSLFILLKTIQLYRNSKKLCPLVKLNKQIAHEQKHDIKASLTKTTLTCSS